MLVRVPSHWEVVSSSPTCNQLCCNLCQYEAVMYRPGASFSCIQWMQWQLFKGTWLLDPWTAQRLWYSKLWMDRLLSWIKASEHTDMYSDQLPHVQPLWRMYVNATCLPQDHMLYQITIQEVGYYPVLSSVLHAGMWHWHAYSLAPQQGCQASPGINLSK